MSGLIIDSEACVGCGRCVRACASGGIVMEGERPNRCAHVTDGCILCGGCVDACPVNAISIERDEAAGAVDLDAYRDIWVFVQTDDHDVVAPVAYELMGKGRELADARGCRLVALAGMGPEGSLEDLEHLVCAGADEVVVCDVYAAREAFDPTASPDRLAEKMRENGINACHISGFQNVADYYRGKIGEGDILISIGAGDVNKILDLIQAMP